MPFGDNQRFDLVIYREGQFVRVQCKTARLRDGAVVFKTCSSQAHRGGGRKGYQNEADFFMAYCPETGKIYSIPVAETGTDTCSLRVNAPKNKQVQHIRWAKDFEF
jgi:hypothetical protein